jgi:hypothetical protein
VTELVLDQDDPYYETEALETGDGPLRRVFVFQFDPVGIAPPTVRSKLDGVIQPGVERVPIENRWTEKFFVNPSAEQYEAERREQTLVLQLEAYLRHRGHDAARLTIVPPGEKRPLFCDIYDKTAGILIEAKGTVAREAIRMAIGQLTDYRRFAPDGTRLAVLVPERPRNDLLALLETAGVGPIWAAGNSFETEGLSATWRERFDELRVASSGSRHYIAGPDQRGRGQNREIVERVYVAQPHIMPGPTPSARRARRLSRGRAARVARGSHPRNTG